jgi:PAS domain S-box-containing protein
MLQLQKTFYRIIMDISAFYQIYASAFSQTDDLIYLLDKDGFLIDCNDKLLHFLGFDKIEGNSPGLIYDMMSKQGLWTSEQLQSFMQHDIDALISAKKKIDQQAIINNKGSILYFELSRTPLSDPAGNILGLIVILRNVTKEKQLTSQLKNIKAQSRNNSLNGDSLFSEKTRPKETTKILLIEDNLIAQKVEKSILMACRCFIDVVATPKQACELFKPGKYDLIFMDLTLDDGNGYNLTAVLRKSEQGSKFRVPIIALTGHDPAEVGLNCEDSEMDGIIQKPLTIDQAKQLIRRYVDNSDVEIKGFRPFNQ